MYETRVNLKHLLEDIRDGYVMPIEEVIIVELVANALDSQAKNISFFIDVLEKSLTVVDDGKGMRRIAMKEYHNIASTTKQRGQGIGFAGVGAKLSLLLAKEVVTESKGGHNSRTATIWHLTSDNRAPWKFAVFSGKVKTSRGTAVSILLENKDSPLLSRDFIINTLKKNFLPLFLPAFQQKIFKFIYPKGVSFYVEGEKIFFNNFSPQDPRMFFVKIKGRQRAVSGFGFLAKAEQPLPEEMRGVAVSTFGKIIKRGWEWLGLDVKDPFIFGVVEAPSLAEILTTNKTDFLQDAASLKKYYKYRKAIQEAALPVLTGLGEEILTTDKRKSFGALSKEIEKALFGLLKDFPEITSLLGFKKSASGGAWKEKLGTVVDFIEQANKQKSTIEQTIETKDESALPQKTSSAKSKQKKSPKITIGFETNDNPEILGRMLENTIWINKNHPAYPRALSDGFESWHILLVVAWVLAGFVEQEKSPLEFISQFFSAFAEERQASLFPRRSS